MRYAVAFAATALLLAAACTKKNPEFCDDNSDCDEGVCNRDLNRCEAADDPDAAPPADAATPPADAPAPPDAGGSDAGVFATLTVSVAGNGTVTSTPPGINCGVLCEAVFPVGESITLNSLPGPSDVLLEWRGSCSGFAECAVELDSSHAVSAHFVPDSAVRWATTFGAGDLEMGTAVAYAPDGSLYLAGLFAGTVSFGGEALVSDSLSQDVFVVRMTPDGSHVWSKRFGGAGNDMPVEIDVDAVGNVVFVAQLDYPSLDGFDAKPSAEVLVAKLNAVDGEAIWTKTLTATGGSATVRAVASDALGNTAVGGGYSGMLDVRGELLESVDSSMDAFIAWYSPTGEYVRAGSYGAGGVDRVDDLVFDADSSTYVVGTFEDSMHLGLTGDTSEGGSDAFVGKFGASGINIYTFGIGGAGQDLGVAIDVDSARNIYVAGRFSGEVDLGDGPVTPSGSGDMFVVSYESTGVFRWAANYGQGAAGFPDLPSDLAVSDRGVVALVGTVAGPVDFGGGELPADFLSGFLLRMDGDDGTHLWSRTFYPGAAGQLGMTFAVAYDPLGVLAATGTFDGTLQLDGADVVGAGDAYVEVYWPK